jgi:8-oxo-dGTP diphosphatase
MGTDRSRSSRIALGAACAIFDDRGQVLLVHHTYGRLNWELPGGAADPHEAPQDTARRELLEETGLELAIERLSGVYYELDPEHEPILHFVFRCRWDEHLVAVAASPEIGELGFWPIDALPTPISDFTERRIADAWAGRPPEVVTVDQRQWRP